MIICPRCSLTHQIGEEFCRKCGSFLLTDEEEYFLKVERMEAQLICPVCQDLYQKGNYCKKCGSVLRQETESQKTNRQPLETKWIKNCSKEWLRLLKEKNELEICLKNLEAQRNRISNDEFTLLSVRYQERLKELLPLHQDIEAELESVRRRATEEIDLLEKEIKPIQKRIEELQFINKQAGITRDDFLKEKQEVNRSLQTRVRNLKKWRQFLSLLPREMRKGLGPQGFKEYLSQPLTLLFITIFIILLGTGGYFSHQWYSQSNRLIAKEIVTPASTPSSSRRPQTALADQEKKKIKSLFETVKQANLRQDIDLFMACFSHDYTNKEKKRAEALKTWSQFSYLHLSYDLKKKMISGDTADIRLEWLIKSSEKVGGKPEESRIVFETVLKKENGSWKIREIKPVS
ncbi:MAG: hypothetical protein FJ107_02700 [Deltaproteobacteria bacterium]|nr:hypothetical protein [Deltaproteobacteria bacterium]